MRNLFKRRFSWLFTLAIAALVVVPFAAFADGIQADADALVAATPHANLSTANQQAGASVEYDFSAQIVNTGNSSNDVFPGTLGVNIVGSGGWFDSLSTNAFLFTDYNTPKAGKVKITVPCNTTNGTKQTVNVLLNAEASSNGKSLSPSSVTLSYEITATTPAASSCTTTTPDTTAPVIAAHADVTAEATSSAGATVNYTSPATSDAVDGAGIATCTPASGSQFALGSTTATCTAEDAAGNQATPTTFVVHVVDTTAPVIAAHADVTAEATSSAGATVTYTPPATTDAVDGAGTATCTPASGNQFALGNTTVTCTAADAAGNAATATSFVVHVVDTTAPMIADHDDVTAEATSANGATVTYTAPATTDAVDGAGTATCTPASGSQFALGNTTITCSAEDAAGNVATTTSFVVHVVDTTPPTITFASRTPAANGNGWNNTNVVVTWNCSDTASGVVAASVSTTLNTEGADQTATGTCEDNAGNTVSADVTGINIDKTAPSVTYQDASGTEGVNGWYTSAVTAHFSASDNLSGFNGNDNPYTIGVSTESAEGSAVTVNSSSVTDLAGNMGSGVDSAAFKIDLSDPTDIAFVGGPSNGGTYYYNMVPSAPTCTASDAISGIASCVVTGYSNAVGSHTLTATATDNAGRTATATRSYSVLAWTLKGFYQPVDMTPSNATLPTYNTVKNGSTVPLKFEVFAGSTELTNTSIISSLTKQVACSTGALEDSIEVTATGGTSLRYDTTAGQFVYNWQTPKTPGACYSVTLKTSDGSSLTAFFKLK